jgi:toxin ParE1/3/4
MGTYRLRPKAVQDLEAIGDFIANDNPARAVLFIDELLVLCVRIAERPDAFQRRNDLADGLRQAVHGRYLVLFTPDENGVVIERVIHGARRLEDLI